LRHLGGWATLAFCAAIPLAALAAAWIVPKQPKVYRIGYSHFPPLLIRGADGPAGFAADVVKEAARRKNIQLEWISLPAGPEAALKERKIDLYPLFANTAARRGKIHMSQPWWESPLALVVDRRSGLKSADQMAGKKIAVVDFSVTSRLAEELFPHSTYVLKGPYEQVLAAACSGEADAGFLTIGLYLELLQLGPRECDGVAVAPILLPDTEITYSIGAAPGAEAAADQIAAAIADLTYDGTLAKIGAKSGEIVTNQAQLTRDLLKTRHTRNLLLLAVGVLLIIMAIVAWQNQRVMQARKAAERARNSEAEFLAHVSHEIRTPMNGVLGMLGLAMETNPEPELHEYLETANHSALALMSVLNDILDFSKIDAGRLELEHIEFSPAHVVDQAIKTLSPESRRKGLSVSREIAPDVPEQCIGDPNRIRQVLLNLIGNAIKFTDRGGVSIKLEVGRMGATDVALNFEVRDSGIGIPRAKQETIFNAFSQADRSTTRKFGGTGLGLAIASRLVEMMHGRIWVNSEPDRGSTFHFNIVLQRSPASVTADSTAA
jgi:signal transduction histidine kinase